MLEVAAAAATAVLAGWLGLVVVLARTAPRLDLREALRLLPDLLRLVSRLARDRDLPRSSRWRLWLLLAYLASPVDLVPDVLPFIGYADDVLLVLLVLRGLVRRAGAPVLARHWPGTPDGLAALSSLVEPR